MRQLILIFLLSCAGCTTVDTIPAPTTPTVAKAFAPTDEDAASLLVRIRNTIGSPSCTASTECKTVAVGARACGGPDAYFAYSTSTTPSDTIEALATRHADRKRAAFAASAVVSTCNIVSDPGAVCDQGVCRIRVRAD